MFYSSSHAAVMLGYLAVAHFQVRAQGDTVPKVDAHRRTGASRLMREERMPWREGEHDSGDMQDGWRLARKAAYQQEGASVEVGGVAQTIAPLGLQLDESYRITDAPGSCAPLKNRVTHATVEVQVGTPGQKFDIVADTGSNYVIIASCLCVQSGSCQGDTDCFQGTNRSRTFKLKQKGHKVPMAYVKFGSGDMIATVATDEVQASSERALLEDSLLLMVSENFTVPGINGILGLGPPSRSTASKLHGREAHDVEESARNLPQGFLGAAGIKRFSLCFNQAADGVLRFREPPAPKELSSIGTAHWGLELGGVSIGSGESSTRIGICGPSTMSEGQKSACGAIPDSGTTMIMAPQEHLMELFGGLCDRWERCASSVHSAGGAHAARAGQGKAKHEAFLELLHDCSNWRKADEGLESLPDIHLHLRGGKESDQQTLALTGNDYVLETREDEMQLVTRNLMGVIPVDFAVPTGRERSVCVPAFGALEFLTKDNGPVWILGTPIFYAFRVGYNQARSPPAISFTEGACGKCHAGSMLETESSYHGAGATSRAYRAGTALRSRATRPRFISNPPLLPSMSLLGGL